MALNRARVPKFSSRLYGFCPYKSVSFSSQSGYHQHTVLSVKVCLFQAKVAVIAMAGFVCRSLSLFQAKVAVNTTRVLSVQVFFSSFTLKEGCHHHTGFVLTSLFSVSRQSGCHTITCFVCRGLSLFQAKVAITPLHVLCVEV